MSSQPMNIALLPSTSRAGDCGQEVTEHISAPIKMRVVDRERVRPGVAWCQDIADALAQVGSGGRRRQESIPVVAVLFKRRQPQNWARQPAACDLPQRVVGGEPGAFFPALAEVALEARSGSVGHL